jgi:MurNAc alpha-1-phosphate uridylyltransferase
MQPVAKAFGYDGAGDFHCRTDGVLHRRAKDEKAVHVFTGVQILHPRLFANAPGGSAAESNYGRNAPGGSAAESNYGRNAPGGPFSLNILYDRAQAEGRLHGLIHDGAWLHIGTPQALAEAEAWFAAREGRT